MQSSKTGLGVKEFYENKTILITGCTGFVGKVVLEKILRSLSFRRIYVMIRPKQGTTLMSRMQKEIFKTRLFDRLYHERPDLDDYIKKKVVTVSGDLCIDKLGFDPEIR